MSSTAQDPTRPSSVEDVPAADLITVATQLLSASTLVCAVSGEVDVSTAAHLRDRLMAEIRLAGPDLVVDLDDVRFLSAAGLSVLVEAKAAADVSGLAFCVVAHTRPVLLPLTLTGLDLVFHVYSHVGGVPVRGGVPDQPSPWSAVEHGRLHPARSPMFPLPDRR